MNLLEWIKPNRHYFYSAEVDGERLHGVITQTSWRAEPASALAWLGQELRLNDRHEQVAVLQFYRVR